VSPGFVGSFTRPPNNNAQAPMCKDRTGRTARMGCRQSVGWNKLRAVPASRATGTRSCRNSAELVPAY